MYVCMHVCMYVYICMYICTYVCIYVCIYVCMYRYIYIYVRMYVYMYVCVCMHVYMYVCMHVCTYVCIYVCMHIHVLGLCTYSTKFISNDVINIPLGRWWLCSSPPRHRLWSPSYPRIKWMSGSVLQWSKAALCWRTPVVPILFLNQESVESCRSTRVHLHGKAFGIRAIFLCYIPKWLSFLSCSLE